MNTKVLENYQRMARAIKFIDENFKSQPSLEEISGSVGMSQFHFQRLFSEWAGVSPKKFMQFLSVEYAKSILEKGKSVMAASYESGLSGTGRLHDLFVKVEGMTPGEYKKAVLGENGNQSGGFEIKYSFFECLFGEGVVASTEKGVCYLAFVEDEVAGLADLKERFPGALFVEKEDDFQKSVLGVFEGNWDENLRLHLKGTEFQLKVWEALLKIPEGRLWTYGDVAKEVGNEKASRAVGTAIGNNPVSFLIPCHRVIRETGVIGEYRWGKERKKLLIGWEAARV